MYTLLIYWTLLDEIRELSDALKDATKDGSMLIMAAFSILELDGIIRFRGLQRGRLRRRGPDLEHISHNLIYSTGFCFMLCTMPA